jgi:putative transposase
MYVAQNRRDAPLARLRRIQHLHKTSSVVQRPASWAQRTRSVAYIFLQIPLKCAMSSLFKNQYRIRSSRLRHYDYAQAGAYFVTINAYQHRCKFGKIKEGSVCPSSLGNVVNECWLKVPEHFPHVVLGEFVVMPNHFHGVLHLTSDGECGEGIATVGRPPGGLQKGSVSSVINSFKGAVTSAARSMGLHGPVWQSRFHDHVIRDEKDYLRIRDYILNNPAKWDEDRYHPINVGELSQKQNRGKIS